MKLRTLFSCALPFAVVACSVIGCAGPSTESVDDGDQAIVGGTEAQPGAWPGTVALYFGSSQGCGGTLVADEWVLTAGHCIVSPSSANGGISKVVINRHKLSGTGGESITVKKVVRHPDWNGSTLDNDLALLQLSSKSTAPHAKLVSSDQASAIVADAPVTVVGWGTMSEGGYSTSDVLRQVTVNVIANAKCKGYSSYENITDNMICAAVPGGGKDSCQGDSGGPLFQKIGADNVQVGIVSWGIGCARADGPGVYTRISNYLSWLSQTSGGAITPGSSTGGGGGTGGGGTGGGGTGGGGTDGAFTPFEESGSVTKGEEKAYAYEVPAGTYKIEMTGTNDADLFVKMNATAGLNAYDCRSVKPGTSAEQCQVTFAEAGKLNVTVRGYRAGTSTFTVKGSQL